MTLPIKDAYPEVGEFILGTVKEIFRQGAFIELDEYPGKRGMLHLSEISLKWVKNIRDYVKKGQKVVLIVLRTDPSRGHIDLSLRRVNDAQRKEKLQDVKQRQRSLKILELLAKDVGEPKDKLLAKMEELILAEHESLYAGLETIAVNPDHVKKLDVPVKWAKKLAELSQKNIKQPFVEITGYVSLKSYAPDGVEVVMDSLRRITKHKTDAEIIVKYSSPPLYRVNVKSRDYKSAEKALKASVDDCISHIEKKGGEGMFHRELPKAS